MKEKVVKKWLSKYHFSSLKYPITSKTVMLTTE